MSPPSKLKKSSLNGSVGSPEVRLGIQLEKALSPKSKKEKRKMMLKAKLQAQGKVEVLKEKVNNSFEEVKSNESVGTENSPKGKGRRRRKRSKKSLQPNEDETNNEPLLEDVNTKNALKALMKTINSEKDTKKELFDDDKYIYLQFNLVKGSPKSKGVIHIPLPHSILPESPEILLITSDLKGKKNDPEESIDFHKEFLREKGIDVVSEIIPIRKLKKEYSQFEERSKMANRFDAVLADGKVNKHARIGRRFGGVKRCVSSINLKSKDLRAEFEKALRRVAVFSSGNGLSFSVKCGRVGMSINDVSENIMCIGNALAKDKILVGNRTNIGSMYIKTALSKSFPVYVSLVSPNEVPTPEGKDQRLPEPVEGELTTVMDSSVVVYPDGSVKLKKRKGSEIEDQENSKKKKVKKPKVSEPEEDSEEEDDEDFDGSDDEDDKDIEDEEDSDDDDESNDEERDYFNVNAEGGDSDEEEEEDSDEEDVPKTKTLNKPKINIIQKPKTHEKKFKINQKMNDSPKSKAPQNKPPMKQKGPAQEKMNIKQKPKGKKFEPNQSPKASSGGKGGGNKLVAQQKSIQSPKMIPVEKASGTKAPTQQKVNQNQPPKQGKPGGVKPPFQKKGNQSPKQGKPGGMKPSFQKKERKSMGGKANFSQKKSPAKRN